MIELKNCTVSVKRCIGGLFNSTLMVYGNVPIKFFHNGRERNCILTPVAGMGAENIWYLMENNYYLGRLRMHGTDWVFDPSTDPTLKNLSQFFGDYLTAWFC